MGMAAAARRKVAVALNGSINSAVSALLLKERGYDVVGVHVLSWRDDGGDLQRSACAAQWAGARRVCAHLGIPCVQVDLVKEYWNDVFCELLDGYQRGVTLNPVVATNRRIIYGHLLEHCERRLGADALATGAFVRVQPDPAGDGRAVQLLRGRHLERDDSYWVSAVPGGRLRRCTFPLGDVESQDEFDDVARRSGLDAVASPWTTHGLRELGAINFGRVLHEYIADRPGPVALLNGEVVGMHRGLHTRTEGQHVAFDWVSEFPRRHSSTKFYVCRRDVATNTLFVVERSDSPDLLASDLTTRVATWVSGRRPTGLASNPRRPLDVQIAVRARSDLLDAKVLIEPTTTSANDAESEDASGDEDKGLLITTQQPSRAITPGQTCAFYDGEVCLGAAEVATVINQHWKRQPLVPRATLTFRDRDH